jgi:glutaredoxin
MRLLRRAKKDAAGVVVEIFSKPECHLCEQAKTALEQMQRRHGFELREVNIAADPALLAEYEIRIPLVWVDGHLVCKYFVDEAALAKAIALASAKRNPEKKRPTFLTLMMPLAFG